MIVFVADLKNQPGSLAHMCEALAACSINLVLAGAHTGDHGVVPFTASDEGAARSVLNEIGVSFNEYPALTLKLPHRPGEAAKVARKLSDAHINIEVWLPTVICGDDINVAVGVDKADDARRLLGDLVEA